MKPLRLFLPIFVAALSCLLPACASRKAASEPKPQKQEAGARGHGPGMLNRMWDRVQLKKKKGETTAEPSGPPMTTVEREVGRSTVQLGMRLEPEPLQLSESRQLKVNLRVSNKTKRLVQLEFPTTQRIEVIIRNSVGALVEQWSEDRSFENEPGLVSINPGEHLEYAATVSTRDMVAGETYTIEALFPNYEPLRVQKKITPVK